MNMKTLLMSSDHNLAASSQNPSIFRKCQFLGAHTLVHVCQHMEKCRFLFVNEIQQNIYVSKSSIAAIGIMIALQTEMLLSGFS